MRKATSRRRSDRGLICSRPAHALSSQSQAHSSHACEVHSCRCLSMPLWLARWTDAQPHNVRGFGYYTDIGAPYGGREVAARTHFIPVSAATSFRGVPWPCWLPRRAETSRGRGRRAGINLLEIANDPYYSCNDEPPGSGLKYTAPYKATHATGLRRYFGDRLS